MKKLIKGIFILMGFSSHAYAQDISINILMNPDVMNVNSTGQIEVTICNEAPQVLFPLPAYKIRPLVSINSLLTITGITDLPTGWTICSNDGQNIRISNGTDNSLQPGECRTFHINVKSNTTTGTAVPITATLGFAGGSVGTACSNGPQSVNNNPANDNSTTSVTVGALPVKLISFMAIKENFSANLNWVTTEESNSDRFDIQRSEDAKNWKNIGTQKAAQESRATISYSYSDHTPINGINYYRLKMIDLDGTFTYSSIKSVEFPKDLISVYPNPTNELVFLRGISPDNIKDIELINSAGLVVYHSKKSPVDGIQTKNFQKGLYLIKVYQKDGTISSHKIILNH